MYFIRKHLPYHLLISPNGVLSSFGFNYLKKCPRSWQTVFLDRKLFVVFRLPSFATNVCIFFIPFKKCVMDIAAFKRGVGVCVGVNEEIERKF